MQKVGQYRGAWPSGKTHLGQKPICMNSTGNHAMHANVVLPLSFPSVYTYVKDGSMWDII